MALLGRTDRLRFVVPDEVIAEITKPEHRAFLETALGQGALSKESISSPEELQIYSDLLQILGSGESAFLPLLPRETGLLHVTKRGFSLGKHGTGSVTVAFSIPQASMCFGFGKAY